MTRGGVDVTSKFEQWQVLDAAGSHSLDTPLGANLAAGTDTTFDVTIKSTQRNSFLNVVLFINSKNYTNKRITINYCKSNGDVLDTISIAGTSDTILLPTFAKLPTNTSYVTITYHVDTYKSSSATFFIPSIGIDNGDTINNFESDSFNTPKMDKCAMLVFPNDSNDAVYEQFNIRKRGKFGGNDDGGSFVYLCTQRYHYSVYTSNSFRVLLNADGKEIRFDMACGGQGNNPVVNVYGDSHDVPFDVAVVKNTTSADNPFVEFDVFVKRTKRYMPFVIVESFQNYRYSEIGEVYIKATAPTLSDPATAFYRKSIGTMGATTDRPAYPVNGYEYYDTDLKKKILWNGSAWVNMDGTALA